MTVVDEIIDEGMHKGLPPACKKKWGFPIEVYLEDENAKAWMRIIDSIKDAINGPYCSVCKNDLIRAAAPAGLGEWIIGYCPICDSEKYEKFKEDMGI